jgi:tetratricopeptide repeat protein
MIARAALAALAVAAIVVSGIWLSDRSSGISARQTLLNPKSSPAELRQGIQDAKHARTLNPSTDPDLTIYGLLLRLGRNAEARDVFESIVRREPDSRNAWTFLAVTSQHTDPAQFRRALEHLHELSPLTARAP